MKKLVACIFAWTLFSTQAFAEASLHTGADRMSLEGSPYLFSLEGLDSEVSEGELKALLAVFTDDGRFEISEEDKKYYGDKVKKISAKVEERFRAIMNSTPVQKWKKEVGRFWKEEIMATCDATSYGREYCVASVMILVTLSALMLTTIGFVGKAVATGMVLVIGAYTASEIIVHGFNTVSERFKDNLEEKKSEEAPERELPEPRVKKDEDLSLASLH